MTSIGFIGGLVESFSPVNIYSISLANPLPLMFDGFSDSAQTCTLRPSPLATATSASHRAPNITCCARWTVLPFRIEWLDWVLVGIIVPIFKLSVQVGLELPELFLQFDILFSCKGLYGPVALLLYIGTLILSSRIQRLKHMHACL